MNNALYIAMIAGIAVMTFAQEPDRMCENMVRALRHGIQGRDQLNIKLVMSKTCRPSDVIINEMKARLAATYDNDPEMFYPYATSQMHYVQLALPEMMRRYTDVDDISIDFQYDGNRGEMSYVQNGSSSEGEEILVSEYAQWTRSDDGDREYRTVIIDRLRGMTNNIVSRNETREEYRWFGKLNPDDLGRIRLIVAHLEKERGVLGDGDLARMICADGLKTRWGNMSVSRVEHEGRVMREINARAFVGPALELVCDEDLKVYSRRIFSEYNGGLIRSESFSYGNPSLADEYPSHISIVVYDESTGEEKCRTTIERSSRHSSDNRFMRRRQGDPGRSMSDSMKGG